MPPSKSPYPAPGEIIGESWRIETLLGEGGMGAVARAWDLILHTPVAIKFMNPQYLAFPGAEERFINEGKASALIKSEHVVSVVKAGKTSTGIPYLVMECLEGLDLSALLARDGRPGLHVERAVHFTLQVLRALQAAHAIGIIHRDMKPSNCFAVTNDGEDDFVKILDFGISKIQSQDASALTKTNSALGTPLYMSPEQARSPRGVDTRSDLYSVGVILYELLTGTTPFMSETGELTEILYKLFTADAPPIQGKRPDLPPSLAEAVHKALARDVSLRFADALAMAEALAPFASERSHHVLSRMRAFKGPRSSVAPPTDLPGSMEAFSNLRTAANVPAEPAGMVGSAAQATSDAPTARGLQHTELLPPGPPVGVAPPRLMQAPLLSQITGAMPYDASTSEVEGRVGGVRDAAEAATQFEEHRGGRPASALASTDLSTARDAAAITPRTQPRSKVPIVVAALIGSALVVVGGATLFRPANVRRDGITERGAPVPDLSVSTAPSPVSSAPRTALPPATTAIPTTVVPSPTATATATEDAGTKGPPLSSGRPAGPRASPRPGSITIPNVLDTDIKQ